MDNRWYEKLDDFTKALKRLEESINESLENTMSTTIKDGVIQRFEFSYEICWKLIKYFLEYEGIESAESPRSTFREAFSYGLIEDGDDWIDMLNDRNLTSHVYDEHIANEIYEKVKNKYFYMLNDILNKLKDKKI